MTRTGACHCGALTVTVIGDPVAVNCCHCEACQRRTGALMHSGAYLRQDQVSPSGPETLYTRRINEDRTITFHFCPTCGSSVYWHLDSRPGHFGVAIGAFAAPDSPPPPTRFGRSVSTPG